MKQFIPKALRRLLCFQNPEHTTITCLFLIISVFIGNVKILALGEFTGEIIGSGGYCAGMTAPITLTISNGIAPYTITITRSGSIIDKDTIISGITTSPEIINVKIPGTYTLKYLVDANLNDGILLGNPVVLIEMPVPGVEIQGLGPVYSKDYYDMVPISGTPQGGTFTGPGIFNSNDSCYFLPRYTPVGTNQIVYSYRESDSSCYGYDTAIVSIWEANALLEFPENRQKYCKNEKPFLIKGLNLANDTGSFSISGGIGLTDNHDNTASIDPSFLSSNEYTITYVYYDGTPLQVKRTIEIVGLDISVKQNSNILEANDNEADYQWMDCNGDSIINGQTNKIFTSPHGGNYAVIIAKDGCVDTSFCYEVIVTNLVGQSKREIEIYPNPIKETFYINLSKAVSDTEITITEMNGRVILKKSYKNLQLIEIVLPAPPGLYLLIINSEKDKVIFPVVKN
jgi:hypothetical protein